MRLPMLILAGLCLAAQPALAEGDAAAGAEAFQQYCKQCHVPVPGDPPAAPKLAGVVGRPVGSLASFRYSEAFQARHAQRMVWTEENLGKFIRAPRRYIPGTAMQFVGVSRGAIRDDIIAYLKTLQ